MSFVDVLLGVTVTTRGAVAAGAAACGFGFWEPHAAGGSDSAGAARPARTDLVI
jgi:hypothetical protein